MTVVKNNNLEKLHIKIGGMQCSFCTESIRKALEGVFDVGVSLAHEEALVQFNPSKVNPGDLHDTLRSIGYVVRDPNKLQNFELEKKELRRSVQQLIAASVITFLALIMMIMGGMGYRQPWFPVIMFGLTLIMIFGVGLPILRMAGASFRRKILNQHVLMEFGAIGGLIGGIVGLFVQPWPMMDFLGAAIFITAYHILSGTVSLMVRTRSSQAIMKLMSLQPANARVVRNGKESEVAVETVRLGDQVRVKPGESIAVDGIILEGTSTVDQSFVTGEPIPVNMEPGSEVIGGSVNQFGTLLVSVTKIGEESFLQQVASSIQEARSMKPGILMAVDRVLKLFIPGVLLAASMMAFLFWTFGAWLLMGAPQFTQAMFSTFAVLVMGYPCALGMATPLAMIRGGGIAAQKGILMRSGEAFQVFKDVTTVVLDKTGTITEGNPQVVKVVALAPYDIGSVCYVAAAAETFSEHPLAQAIVDYARIHDYLPGLALINEFQVIPGFGVKAVLNDDLVMVGSPRFLKKNGVFLHSIKDTLHTMEQESWTVVVVAKAREVIGMIALADPPKEDASEAITNMKAIGLEPILVTGDNRQTATSIANIVGIKRIAAEMLPAEKAAFVRELQQKGKKIAMVGDGINDAPALMQADVGIALGTGSDIAIESADVILISNKMVRILDAYNIGKNSYVKTKQNVLLAFTFNGIGVPLAITGLIHPVLAMVAMALSVSTILINSFGSNFLLKFKPKEETR
jgi:heavy metal translocating P-type ATPase